MSKMMVKRDGLWTPMANLKGDTGPLPADNSVTNDALVTDGAKTNTAYLMGNRLTATAEGEMISVDDSYPSAALSLMVDGKSTQLTTTGKNLLNPTVAANTGGWLRRRTSANSYGTIVDSGGTNCNIFLVPLENGQSLTYSRGSATKLGFHFVYTTDEILAVGSVLTNIVTLTNYSRRTFTNSTGDTVYVGVAVSVNSTTADAGVLENAEAQLEYATAFTSYEPYSGGAASPRPDWPQEIESVDEPALEVRALNLWGGERLRDDVLANGGYTSSGESDNGRWVSFGTAQTAGKRLYGGPFRENTQYTFILLVLRTNSTSVNVNLNLKYTDGTSVYMQRQAVSDVSQPSYIVLTSAAGKTVDGIYGVNHGNTTYIYYDYCGVFEGDVDIDSYEVYSGSMASLLPEGTSLRSLPDGTKDELYLTYLKPSSREGWAWYEPALTANVGHAVLDGSESWVLGTGTSGRMYTRQNDMLRATNYQQLILCTSLQTYPYYNSVGSGVTGISGWNAGRYPGENWFYVAIDGITTGAEMKQWFTDNPAEVIYPLATPITTQLDPIELPIMQAGMTNIWTDPSTSLSVTYERDRNIVISKLEAAAADLATS